MTQLTSLTQLRHGCWYQVGEATLQYITVRDDGYCLFLQAAGHPVTATPGWVAGAIERGIVHEIGEA